MAKAALEMAVLDAELRAPGSRSLARDLGAVRDRVAVRRLGRASWTRSRSCSTPSPATSTQGYVRIKLKIEPGWDVEPVRAVRERFGDDVLLQVDANTAYTLADAPAPGPARPVRPAADRAAAATRTTCSATPSWPRRSRTPVCLDESITSARVPPPTRSRSAPARSSTSSRAGSAATSRRGASTTSASRTASRCGAAACSRPASAAAANVALAALPGFTLPGDTSASDRYFRTDVTSPFVLDDGHLSVPTGPGIGVTPLPDELDAVTTSTECDRAVTDIDLSAELSRRAGELGIPGAAVGIYLDGEEYYAFHGVTSVENPLPVDEHTLFQFGSTGKTYTATAILRLVDQGEVDLHAPVRTLRAGTEAEGRGGRGEGDRAAVAQPHRGLGR